MEANFRVDFDKKRLDATVNYSVLVVSNATTELLLDTNNLVVHRVAVTGTPVEFILDPEVAPFGRALRVPLLDVAGGNVLVVTVSYSTTDASAALQWLTPEQTAGVVPLGAAPAALRRQPPSLPLSVCRKGASVPLHTVPGHPRAVAAPVPGLALR